MQRHPHLHERNARKHMPTHASTRTLQCTQTAVGSYSTGFNTHGRRFYSPPCTAALWARRFLPRTTRSGCGSLPSSLGCGMCAEVQRKSMRMGTETCTAPLCCFALTAVSYGTMWCRKMQKVGCDWTVAWPVLRSFVRASLGIVCLFACLQLARAVFDGFSQVEVRTRVHAPSRVFILT